MLFFYPYQFQPHTQMMYHGQEDMNLTPDSLSGDKRASLYQEIRQKFWTTKLEIANTLRGTLFAGLNRNGTTAIR